MMAVMRCGSFAVFFVDKPNPERKIQSVSIVAEVRRSFLALVARKRRSGAENACVRVRCALLQLLSVENDGENVFRALVALGTLVRASVCPCFNPLNDWLACCSVW